MNTSIVWFTTDLRLQDNETLVKAIATSQQIIPVYCIDDAHFTTTKFGTNKTGSFRAKFLLEALRDLDSSLRALGSGLLVVKGNPEIEILNIARTYNATSVFSKKQLATEENNTEKLVANALQAINCSLHTCSTSTLYYEQNLPFSIENLPDVFTAFRKQVEKFCTVNAVFAKPIKINSPILPTVQFPALMDLGLLDMNTDTRIVLQFIGGETEAQKRLRYYFYETKAISKYKETRNGLIGANYSSKFSAWLSLGCISASSIYSELKKYEMQYGENESTYWLFFELLWRDYFYFVMQKFGKKLFIKNGIKETENKQLFFKRDFDKWTNGQTGVEFVDANMQELNLTGFMSNRGRQNVASYLCNDLKIDWRYGAAFFEQQLIDYDVASNWGNWAYLAGVGNDLRPNRYFNITKQANDYDANGAYRKLWLK
jgi:deoxyribodipyrimidine photo-lyase